jgi:2-oxoisovalerate dehydrogenase E1 component beta subunit
MARDDDRDRDSVGARVGGDSPQASPSVAADQAKDAEDKPGRAKGEEKRAKGEQVEAGAAGQGAEPRGKRTDKGEATYLIAIAEALWEEMERDEHVYLLGEDIGAYGGAFKVTEGFIDRFGEERVMDTPICEETIVGMAIGSAMEGYRPVGKYHYRSGVPIPAVFRGPSGGGVRASAFHSTNPEPWFAAAPGLKVICPASPTDAKGLLKAAIRDDNPCIYLEHKWIYRRIREDVPTDPDFTVPIGQADVKREGDDVSIVTYGAMVYRALEAADELADRDISAEVLDLRTIFPLDREAVLKTVEKTSRALVLTESLRFLGVSSEVSAVIAEDGFELLDAPVMRLAPPHTPVPFSPPLEDAFLPQVDDVVEAVERLSKW